jgi:hypothetical protein
MKRGHAPRHVRRGHEAHHIVLDEQTRLLVENMVRSNTVADATDDMIVHADAVQDGAEPIAGRDAGLNPSRSAGGDAGQVFVAIEPGNEGDR